MDRSIVEEYYFLGYNASPEYGGDMFLRNVDLLSTHYTVLYPRRQSTSNPGISGYSCHKVVILTFLKP
jgi:hypothetical protein